MAAWTIAIHWVSKFILIGLFGLSFWSIAIMIERAKFLKLLAAQDPFDEAQKYLNNADLTGLLTWAKAHKGLRSGTLLAASSAKTKTESADRAVRGYLNMERMQLERGLTVLATLGSNAPFIGLFGTVLGIIQAFAALSDAQSAASSVMVGISEALFATAVGLFVAIPAVVAYNVFSRKIKVLISECEALRDQYLAQTIAQKEGL